MRSRSSASLVVGVLAMLSCTTSEGEIVPRAPLTGPASLAPMVATPAPVADDNFSSEVVDAPQPPPATTTIESAPIDDGPRMAATNHFAYIFKSPEKKGLALGYIR